MADDLAHLNLLLAHYGEDTHRQLALDADGFCRVQMDDDITVTMEAVEDTGRFYLYAPVVMLDPTAAQEQMSRALVLNQATTGTSGCSCILYGDPAEFMMMASASVQETSIKEFRVMMNGMVESVGYLRGELEDALEPEEA